MTPRARSLAATAVLISLSCSGEVNAGEYIVKVAGVDGTAFAATCLLLSADQARRYDVTGTVPRALEYAGDLISCAIQRRAGAGALQVVITTPEGRTVAKSSGNQPFGVIMAAGR